MHLQDLKKEVDSLRNIEEIVDGVSSLFQSVKKTGIKTAPGMKQVQPLLSQLRHAQLINEKLSSLAYYLIQLKVTSITDDKKKNQYLASKFLKDSFLNLHTLIDQIKMFEQDIAMLTQVHIQLLQAAQNAPLEQSIVLQDPRYKFLINDLTNLNKKQKQYTRVIGKQFVVLARNRK